MPQAFAILLALGIVLAIITLVGHGIWVLLRALFVAPAKPERHGCGYCGQLTARGRDRCEWCGRSLVSIEAKELEDIQAVERQLHRFRRNGTLKPEFVDNMLARLARYRQALLQGQLLPQAEPQRTPPRRADRPVVPPVLEVPVMAEVLEQPAPALPREVHVPPVAPPQAVAAALVQPPAAPRPRPAVVVAEPIEPALPKRAWSEVLASFMEERNIRWGEVVGGLLMVGSSIALVLSLWRELQRIPYFPFLLFVAITAAIFGVGLYSHHRWKLAATSRGLLIIATLLVPLNFLAMAGLTRGSWDWITLVMELAGLGVFAYLTGLSGQVVAPGARWQQVLGVVGGSAVLRGVTRLLSGDAPAATQFIAAAVPTVIFATAIGAVLIQRVFQRRPTLEQIAALLTALGTSAFALVVVHGMMVAQAEDIAAMLHRLAPLVAIGAAIGLAAGLTVVRGTRRGAASATWHTAGTIITLLCSGIMLAAVGLAWPHPLGMIVVGTIDAGVLAWAAFRWRMPMLHAVAMACATVVYLCTFHGVVNPDHAPWIMGSDDSPHELLRLLIDSSSGTALAGLFLLFGVVSETLALRGRRAQAAYYAAGSGVMAVLGLLLVTVHGLRRVELDATQMFWPALRAAVLYVLYGSGSLALAARWRRSEPVGIGLCLVALAAVWALRWHPATRAVDPLWAAVLSGEALVMAVIATLLGRTYSPRPREEGVPSQTSLDRAGEGLGGRVGGTTEDSTNPHPQPLSHSRPADEANMGAKPTAAGHEWERGVAPLRELYRQPLLRAAEAAAIAAGIVGALVAWTQVSKIDHRIELPLATASFAATYLLLAWQKRSLERTWTASLAVMVGLVHTLVLNYSFDWLTQPWQVGLLLHATLALVGAMAIEWFARRANSPLPPVGEGAANEVFVTPLEQSALVSAALCVPALALAGWSSTAALAGCMAWLAGVLLVVALRQTSREVFAAHQAVLTFAVGLAAAAWAYRQDWFTAWPFDLLRPESLHAIGLSLGLLSLAWIVVRLVASPRPVAAEPSGVSVGGVARVSTNPHPQPLSRERERGVWRALLAWPSVDWVVRHALIVATLVLSIAMLLPAVAHEFDAGLPAQFLALQQIAFGGRFVLLLAVLAAVLVASLWDRFGRAEVLGGVMLVAATACALAARASADLAAASAWRWALSVGFLLLAAGIWLREPLLDFCRSARMRLAIGPFANALTQAAALTLFTAPVVLLTVLAAGVQLGGGTMNGPALGSFFARLGPSVSYLLPLGLVIAGLVGFALRERSAGYAFCGGLVTKLTVGLGYALYVTTVAQTNFGGDETVVFVQLLTVTAAVWAIGWLAMRTFAEGWLWPQGIGAQAAVLGRVLMAVQLGFAGLGNVLLLGTALFALIMFNANMLPAAAGGPLGWAAFVLAIGAVVFGDLTHGDRPRPNVVGLCGLTVMAMVALSVERYSAGWGYRTLLIGWAVYALLIVAASWWAVTLRASPDAHGPPQAILRMAATWVVVAGVLAVLLGLKAALFHDWVDMLWAAAAIAIASAALATMAVWRRQEGWAFAAALGANLAASLVVWHAHERASSFAQWWMVLVQANVIASAVVALLWLAVRRRLYQMRELNLHNSPLLALQITLPVVAMASSVAYRLEYMLSGNASINALAATPLGWVALAAAATAAIGAVGQRSTRDALAGVYFLVLAAIITQMTSRPATPQLFCWKAVCILAAFVVLTALAGWALTKAKPLWRAIKLDENRGPAEWFLVSQALLTCVAAALAAWTAIDYRFTNEGVDVAIGGLSGRITGVFGALMLFGAAVLMAWQTKLSGSEQSPWRRGWQWAAMAAFVLTMSCFGWARLSADPETVTGAAPWLHRCVLLMIPSAMMTLMSGVGLSVGLHKMSDWITAGRRAMPFFAAVALAMLVAVLGQEMVQFQWPAAGQPGGAPIALWAAIVVAVALVGLAAGAVAVAVVPRLDPFGLSERGRTAYVYAAEVLLALVGLHLWLSMPHLFMHGVVRHYWMLIAMGVAFGGAGLSELFRRRGLAVLSEPLANTALVLPAVPAIGFWFMPAAIAETLYVGDGSPVLWLLMGCFYGVLALRRGSVGLAALAIVTGNTGLWVLWDRLGWAFFDRPQLWLIPLALAALVAEHLDRRRLNEAQRSALRYVALSTIYLSSTVEFWRAVGGATILPLALVTIGLSVAGILAGIMLRVRSFLYLGVTFLAVVLGRMIFYFAFQEGNIWLFWTCCIVLGAAIIALFAVFEKRRNDILAAVERFRQWEQ